MVVREDAALAEVSSEERVAGLTSDLWKLALPLPGGIDFEQAYSTSGREPNNLFYNLEGRDFVDVSAVSGIDSRADGRVLARLDLDRDGFVDLAVANANAPTLELFRNRIGDRLADRRFLAVRLVGGQGGGPADGSWSARDACGARVEIDAGGRRRSIEHRCGEGFGAQNSSTLLAGLGRAERIDRVAVRWPSGRTTELTATELAAGELPPVDSLLTLHERPEPGRPAAAVAPYRP